MPHFDNSLVRIRGQWGEYYFHSGILKSFYRLSSHLMEKLDLPIKLEVMFPYIFLINTDDKQGSPALN